MPSIRYTRDKRGYETTYVVHGARTTGQGLSRSRVLYLFRTPSQLTVGRRPLDEESRVALEHTHPDLSFDWQALDREVLSSPKEPPPRPWREQRDQLRSSRAPQQSPPARTSPPAPMVVDDRSVLGRTLGAPEAARLRSRYSELLLRIVRRARGPEERDQLTERAQRLNPDDWADETTVRAGVSTVEAEWDGLTSGLPQRRRGRRGGRRREGEAGTPAAEPSAIMGSNGDVDEGSEDNHQDRPDRAAGTGGDRDRLGTGTGDGLPVDD